MLLTLAVGQRQLTILVEDLLRTAVEAEIEPLAHQPAGQRIVLVLLPPGSDHRDRAQSRPLQPLEPASALNVCLFEV